MTGVEVDGQRLLFTSAAFSGVHEERKVAFSMDRRGRWLKNVMVDRFRSTVTFKDV